MRIFLDTEFNGFKGELLSIALCAENGDSFYGVCYNPEFSMRPLDPWVAINVMPHIFKCGIAKPDDNVTVSVRYDILRAGAMQWLKRYVNPTIIVDWPSDLVHFFGLMLGDSHEQSQTFFQKVEVKIQGYRAVDPLIQHNAYYDARAARDSFLGTRVVKLENERLETLG